jgi:hypothetical protein
LKEPVLPLHIGCDTIHSQDLVIASFPYSFIVDAIAKVLAKAFRYFFSGAYLFGQLSHNFALLRCLADNELKAVSVIIR